MRRVILLFGAVLASFAFATAAPSPSAAAARDCFSDGSGHPGCRIVRISDGRFSVPQIVASASLWLQFDVLEEPTTDLWLVAFREGTFTFASFIGGGSFGILLGLPGTGYDPGTYVIELRESTMTGALLDTLVLTLRSG